MRTDQPLASLRAALRELSHLQSAAALLAWDQETYMPPHGIDGRAEALATLAGLSHARFTGREMGDLIEALAGQAADLQDAEQALLREVRRDYQRATRVPNALVKEIAEATSQAQAAWQAARQDASFAAFQPHLQRLLDLKLQVAAAVGFADVPLDALLDEYEQGTTVRFLEGLFTELKAALVPLVSAIRNSGHTVDTGPLRRSFDEAGQLRFASEVATAMGFDFRRGRIDRSAHPFCTGIHRGDTRLTWRTSSNDLRPGLYGVIHEAGHGLYEQGLPDREAGTPLGEATSLGIHESQSRLWENMVARSRSFWIHFLPRLRQAFPGVVEDVDVDAMYQAANEVTPSAIRVEADELTYNLHIVLRFEIERDLFAGTLRVADLPEAWNDAMQRLLGIRPANNGDGVLQDIHWSLGAFGYFPTYTLGNLYAAQLFAAAQRDIGDLDAAMQRGDFGPLRDWLRARVHVHGRRYPARELVRLATGREPTQDDFMSYARAKFTEVYRLG